MEGITITGAVMLFILVFFCIYGFRQGFIKEIFDLFSFFITGILTWLLYPVLAGMLLKTPLYEKINSLIQTTLKDNVDLNESLPEYLMKLPGFMKDSIMNSSKQAFNSLVESTSEAMTVLTINIISIIVLFIIVRVISYILKKYSSKINKIILIGKINALLGGFFGIIQGLFVIYLIVLVISFFPTSKIYERTAADIEVSYIGKTIFKDDSTFFGIKARYPKKLISENLSEKKDGTEND